MRALLLALIACSSPPPPTIPPRSDIGPELPAATACFPPYNSSFAHDWFVLADLDLGVSCRVFLEQDDCVLGIFRDCTDPSPMLRQWVGVTSTEMTRDLLEFSVFHASGTIVGRPPKCCEGELIDDTWASLDCFETACGAPTDVFHVGAQLERETGPMPFAERTQREELSGATDIVDFVVLPAKQEIWAVSDSEILLHTLQGNTRSLANVTDPERLIASTDGNTIYVADGNDLIRIDATVPQVVETIDAGGPIEILERSTRGIVVGAVSANQTVLTLRRPNSIATIDGQSMFPRLAAVIEIPNGTEARAFFAAPVDVRGDLMVLTSSLSQGSGAPNVERSPRAFHAVGAGVIGYLADCSERSTEGHCWFEIDLASNDIRRTGIPDIGDITDAAHDAVNDRIVFSGPEGLAALDRATWRPLVQARVPFDDLTRLAIAGTEVYAAGENGFIERFTQQ
jgi:hypothetical protein